MKSYFILFIPIIILSCSNNLNNSSPKKIESIEKTSSSITSEFQNPTTTSIAYKSTTTQKGTSKPQGRYSCTINSAGYCIFSGSPHNTILNPQSNKIKDREGNYLFSLEEAVATNSSGKILEARGTPSFDGDKLIKSSKDNMTNDEKSFHHVMAIMYPIRNALMYDIAELKKKEWNELVFELTKRKIKEKTFTDGRTPKDNYYGTEGIFDLAKNPKGKDIHHEVMKFLEESSIYLLCHATSEEFNQMLKDTHPEQHDPCNDAINEKKIPF